ncbi:MAG TPA: PLP-dependent transferase [Crenalkalicoccus sp.]|nr:PLP-dependent transferase [Crenalkalicoccus sp.]
MPADAAATATPIPPRLDRFGNVVDPTVSYARGSILGSNADEIVRQRQAYAIARERRDRLGDDSIYNLTGLIRGFPFRDGDAAKLRSYIHSGAMDKGELPPLALRRLGGNLEEHDAFLCNRVSAAILATMLALLKAGDLVWSVVPADRCHPSVKNSVLAAGGRFEEAIGADAFEEALAASAERPRMVVISAISPSKHHLPEAEVIRCMEAGRRAGALVMIDDAHMAARLAVYDEHPPLELGADVAVWSLDKHVGGPRSGIVAGRKELIREIRAKAFMFGLEAQPGSIVAGLNAVLAFDPAPIKSAAAFADRVMAELQVLFEGRAYRAGPGVAIAGEDLMELALRRSGTNAPRIAPIEATAAAAMLLLQNTGAVTIPVSGMPGSACVYRLMMFPDGERLGAGPIVDGTRKALEAVSELVSDRDATRRILMGDA